jgi:enediyne core biosynthesis thioesterase
LKDSNAYGNSYFSRYFEWQGILRERWLHQCIAPDMLKSAGMLITKCAHQDYVHETFPLQAVECELNTFEVKQCSLHLVFRFMVAGAVVSRGYQQIVFASHQRRVQRIPKHALDKAREFELPEGALLG